jgi:hypothetical protein
MSNSCISCMTRTSWDERYGNTLNEYCNNPQRLYASTGAGAGLTNDDSFHVLDFALGSVSAALLLLVAAVVAHRVRRPRQPHAPMPISEEESSKDDEKAVLTQAV